MKKISLLIVSFLMAYTMVHGQENPPPPTNPPVLVETMFNDRGVFMQSLVQKRLRSAPKFGVFAVTDILGSWHRSEADEYMVQGNLTYELAKGFDLMGGFHMASGIGMRPATGILYTFATPEFLLVLNPRYYIDNIGNLEGFALAEYKPRISEDWSFYSKVQGIYGFTADGGNHARSYVRLRAGVTYREFSFGPAANFDFYGPKKINENSFGVFATVALF